MGGDDRQEAAEPEIPPLLELAGVGKTFGETVAVAPLDLTVNRGDFFAILGPSGCGKSTLLKMIGGFVQPTSGNIRIDGEDITRLGPEKRPVNMVFQGYGLFPHMTVRQNIAYGLKLAKLPPEEIDQRVDEAMTLVRLGELAERAIPDMSGGQQQRVALARALVMRPLILLLDEPLAALDLKLRQQMQRELRRIHDEIGGTFMFVTHDQTEALSIASRIGVMNEGRMVQEGRPEEIYASPGNEFVSTFIGEANLLQGLRQGGRVELEAGPVFTSPGEDGPVVTVIRPERMSLVGESEDGEPRLQAVIENVVFMGPYLNYELQLDSGEKLLLRIGDVKEPGSGATRPAVGDQVLVGWRLQDHRVIHRGP